MIHYGTTTDVLFLVTLFSWLSPYILSEDSYIGPYVVELPPKVDKRITFGEQSSTSTLTDCKRW
jgi:hypothetical protein